MLCWEGKMQTASDAAQEAQKGSFEEMSPKEALKDEQSVRMRVGEG